MTQQRPFAHQPRDTQNHTLTFTHTHKRTTSVRTHTRPQPHKLFTARHTFTTNSPEQTHPHIHTPHTNTSYIQTNTHLHSSRARALVPLSRGYPRRAATLGGRGRKRAKMTGRPAGEIRWANFARLIGSISDRGPPHCFLGTSTSSLVAVRLILCRAEVLHTFEAVCGLQAGSCKTEGRAKSCTTHQVFPNSSFPLQSVRISSLAPCPER